MKDCIFYRVWAAAVLLALPSSTAAVSTVPRLRPATLEQRERQLSRTLTRTSQFEDVPHINRRWSCEQAHAPVALTTPDPLFVPATRGNRVQVSFIIGVDGRVRSPLILESAGLAGDRRVIETVRHWRYRPATCNGVPTETEGKIEFSIR